MISSYQIPPRKQRFDQKPLCRVEKKRLRLGLGPEPVGSVTVRLLLPSKNIGGLIGRGGATISDIRKQSMAHIEIDQNCIPGAEVRVAACSGPCDNVIVGLQMMTAKLAESSLRRYQEIHSHSHSSHSHSHSHSSHSHSHHSHSHSHPHHSHSHSYSVANYGIGSHSGHGHGGAVAATAATTPSLIPSCSASSNASASSQDPNALGACVKHDFMFSSLTSSTNNSESGMESPVTDANDISSESKGFMSPDSSDESAVVGHTSVPHTQAHIQGVGSNSHEMTLLIETRNLFHIIGAVGEKITQMIELSGAEISVSKVLMGNSSEKTVNVRGEKENVFHALSLLVQQVESNPNPVPVRIPFDPRNEVTLPNVLRYDLNTGFSPSIPLAQPLPAPGPVGSVGPFTTSFLSTPANTAAGAIPTSAHMGALDPMQATTLTPYSVASTTHHTSHSSVPKFVMTPQHPYRTQPAPYTLAQNTPTIVSDVVIPVPHHRIGAIIGKGGKSVQEIRRQTKAMISIDKAKAGVTERMVTVSGSPEQIAAAVWMIQTCMLPQQA